MRLLAMPWDDPAAARHHLEFGALPPEKKGLGFIAERQTVHARANVFPSRFPSKCEWPGGGPSSEVSTT